MKDWTNKDNKNFYGKMSFKSFIAGAIQGGLDTCNDVQALTKYILTSRSILEIGAGYGRVLTHIINMGYQGDIYAIERIEKFHSYLKSQFKNKAHIFCADISNFKTNLKFDLILWMWASICEFSKKEQLPILSKLTSLLNKNGRLVLDIIPIECKTINATDFDEHNRVINTRHGKNYGYFPSAEELGTYASKLNLRSIECITYETQTQKKRNLYVLQKI